MIVEFKETSLKELYETGRTKAKEYKVLARDVRFVEKYVTVIDSFKSAKNIDDIANQGKLNYEKLKHGLSGLSSVRIIYSRIERLIFQEEGDKITVTMLKIDKTHYGQK